MNSLLIGSPNILLTQRLKFKKASDIGILCSYICCLTKTEENSLQYGPNAKGTKYSSTQQHSDTLKICEDISRQVWLHLPQPLPAHLCLTRLGRCIYIKVQHQFREPVFRLTITVMQSISQMCSPPFLKGDGSFVLKLQVTSRAELDLTIALFSQTAAELKSAQL